VSEVINPGDQPDLNDLPHFPRTFVVLKRRPFPRLIVYKRLTKYSTDYVKVFKCWTAIGAAGFATPSGPAMIKTKARHPDWQMPNSSWVPRADWGRVIPGNTPDNPIKEAFLKITDDGVGIHGTDNLLSLKTRSSHGCIRVSPENAIWLYENVEVGSPVYL
jgi:hypothetical protein